MPISRDFRAFRWLLAQTIGLGLIAGIATTATIVSLRSDALEAAGRDESDLAIVIGREISASTRAIESALNDAERIVRAVHPKNEAEFRQLMATRAISVELRDLAVATNYVDGIGLADANGDLVSFSKSWPVPNANISHESDFIYLAEHDVATTYFGRPEDERESETSRVYFARRLNAADGTFLGLAHVGIQAKYFDSIYSAIAPLKEKTLTLLRRDGGILIRYPSSAYARANVPADSPWFRLAGSGGGRFLSPGYFDGVARQVAVHPLDDFPLVVDVAQPEDAILATWRMRSAEIGFGVCLALLCSGFLARAQFGQLHQLIRSEKSLESRNRDMEELNARFDSVLENMPQGVALFAPDRRLIVANRRYGEMYQLAPRETRPGATLEEIVARRIARGIFVDNPESYIKSRLAALDAATPRQALDRLSNGRVVFISGRPLDDGSWLTVHEDVTARQLADDEIERLALYDPLTGAANRALLLREMARRLQKAESPLTVLLVDLDEFKAVNDTMGHPSGDALLIKVTARLRAASGTDDLVARVGGDEFAILASERDGGDGSRLAECVLAGMREPFDIEGYVVAVRVSVGLARAPRDGADVESLLRNADLALYRAKSDGRDRVVHFDPSLEFHLREARLLKAELAEAITRGQFEVFYQPIVDAREGRVIDVEALVRWRHPSRGMIPPDLFIKLAEQTGQIQAIGEFVLRAACAQATRWPASVGVSINLSPKQFAHGNLVALVAEALDACGLEPHRLTLEITESALIENIEASGGALAAIRELGVRIALDDFGTGYSSLSYLQSFIFDEIKIDRSFVRQMETNERTRAIVALIAAIARTFDARIVAEGVETQAQLDLIVAAGCGAAQGYLFAKPKPIEEVSFDGAPSRAAA